MSKTHVILLVTAAIFILVGTMILFMAPSKKAIKKDMNVRIKAAKRDQWSFRN